MRGIREIVFACIVLVIMLGCVAFAEGDATREILAVYSSPNSQIVTNSDDSKELVDTIIYLYTDYSYTQYILHENHYKVYSTGTFEVDFDWDSVEWGVGDPHIMTIHASKVLQGDHELEDADLTYEVDLDKVNDYCLYPDDVRDDANLVAAFMQADKQLLLREDGSQEYLPTMWFYYDDGTFTQYVVRDKLEDVLFSAGDYSLSDGGFADAGTKLTIHRTQKYQDGNGLQDYESTHDYEIGSLGFLRVYPDIAQ